MLIKNNRKCPIQHTFYDEKKELQIIEIAGGEVKEIQDDIAELWLKNGLVIEYVEPKKAKEEKEELLAKIAKLEAENAALKEPEEEKKAKEEKEEVKKEVKKTTKKGK